jgi:formiminoglutamase
MLQGIKDYPKAKYIVVGGSNDQSYCNASAMIEGLGGRIGVINIDAHLDVRPLKEGKAHSGSPFRLLLEDERFKGKFVEFGAKGYCCSKKHADYVLDKGGQIVWMERDIRRARIEPGLSQAGSCFRTLLNSLTKEVDWVFVSFDIDSIDCGSMPGVSAPNTTGGL